MVPELLEPLRLAVLVTTVRGNSRSTATLATAATAATEPANPQPQRGSGRIESTRPDVLYKAAYESMEGVKRLSFYRIRVKGHLDERWSEWFDGLEITNLKNGEAMLSGEIVDQAALHGVLNKVRDLNLALVAVSSVSPERQDPTIRPARY